MERREPVYVARVEVSISTDQNGHDVKPIGFHCVMEWSSSRIHLRIWRGARGEEQNGDFGLVSSHYIYVILVRVKSSANVVERRHP